MTVDRIAGALLALELAGTETDPLNGPWKRQGLVIEISKLPKVVAHVRGLPGEMYLRREVADALNVSASTVSRLASKVLTLAPTSYVINGTLTIPVYDIAVVGRLQTYLAEHRCLRGRRRLWTDKERVTRQAAYSAMGYRRRRALELRERGEQGGADRVDREADRMLDELRQQHSRARRDLG